MIRIAVSLMRGKIRVMALQVKTVTFLLKLMTKIQKNERKKRRKIKLWAATRT